MLRWCRCVRVGRTLAAVEPLEPRAVSALAGARWAHHQLSELNHAGGEDAGGEVSLPCQCPVGTSYSVSELHFSFEGQPAAVSDSAHTL